MIDMLKSYLQVASGVSQLTRQRALDVAKQVLEATPAAGVLPVAAAGAESLSQQAAALADELLAASRQNRAMLLDLVRAEVETVVTRLGLAGSAELEAALASSRARVVQLERELARRDAEAAADKAPAKKAQAKKATVKKATATKTAAKRGTASRKGSTARRATSTGAP